MSFDIRSIDLAKLNSMTKYPSIPTYHILDPKNGSLLEETLDFGEDTFIVTEKIDGTNARIICLPGGVDTPIRYIIGSREELLYARGDLIGNPAMGIVAAIDKYAESLSYERREDILVIYGEVYGGKVTSNSKQYTGSQQVGFRIFDAVSIADYQSLLEQTPAQLSLWRENGGQRFVEERVLENIARNQDIELTPRLIELSYKDLPKTIDDTYAFLKQAIVETESALDDGAGGRPEGIVVRTPSRSKIAKIRYEDYERTLKRRK